MADDEWVWLRNPTTGGVARLHITSADLWRGRGWEDTEEPDPVDPTMSDEQPPATPARKTTTARKES
jgi:hypothetical protein